MSNRSTQTWFAVDKRGLAKLVERKGKHFVLYELVQNAWDENTTKVDIVLKRLPGGMAELAVSDDNPSGFADVTHAFTLFADSSKKHNAEQRGRFNLGEKLVLALCAKAEIASTKGTMLFDAKGRHEKRRCLDRGTAVTVTLKLNAAEFAELSGAANWLLPPAGITTTYNGAALATRPALAAFEAALPTEIADREGVLRATQRKTTIEVVEPADGQQATLYEMGIPVVEHDGRWHINIGQKVPLNMDRDNVTPSYLGKVRALVTEHMAEYLSQEDANSAWVKDAVTRHGETMAVETINRLTDLRFGQKRVAYDLSDPEANALAVTKGYTVVHGRSFNKAEWEAIRRTGAIRPAGQVTPSPKPFHPDGKPLRLQPEDQLTEGMKWFAAYATKIAEALLHTNIDVMIANDPGWHFLGAYGKGSLTINVAKAGYGWFEGSLVPVNDFLIHEFGHHYSGDHLSEDYHDALTRLGGKLTQLALDRRELFNR